jgi:hypothetical protein
MKKYSDMIMIDPETGESITSKNLSSYLKITNTSNEYKIRDESIQSLVAYSKATGIVI